MNTKLTKVDPFVQVQKDEYIAGSQAGNYFLIVSETSDGIVAFRPLNTSKPAKGSKPTIGQRTRVRVVPSSAWGTPDLDKLMNRFGFGRVNGDQHVHYSTVTTDAPKAIADAQLALRLAA